MDGMVKLLLPPPLPPPLNQFQEGSAMDSNVILDPNDEAMWAEDTVGVPPAEGGGKQAPGKAAVAPAANAGTAEGGENIAVAAGSASPQGAKAGATKPNSGTGSGSQQSSDNAAPNSKSGSGSAANPQSAADATSNPSVGASAPKAPTNAAPAGSIGQPGSGSSAGV